MRITASATNVGPGLALLVTSAAAFVASLDLFIVNIALLGTPVGLHDAHRAA